MKDGGVEVIVVVHVDDMKVIRSKEIGDQLCVDLNRRFPAKSLGGVDLIHGICIRT